MKIEIDEIQVRAEVRRRPEETEGLDRTAAFEDLRRELKAYCVDAIQAELRRRAER